MSGQTEAFGYQQLLRHTPGQLCVQFYAGDAVADPGTVTAVITRGDGTTLTPAAAVQGSGSVLRTLALTAAEIPSCDRLTVTWASTLLGTVTTYADVTGGLLFTIKEARAVGDGKLNLADDTKYPTALLELGRARVHEAFMEICGTPFVPLWRRDTLDGCGPRMSHPGTQGVYSAYGASGAGFGGTYELMLPAHRIVAVRAIETREIGATTWTAFSADELADVQVDEWGRLTRESMGWFPCGRRNVRVTYEYGYTQPPFEIRRAALMLLRASLVNSNTDERATSMSTEVGTFTLATAGTKGNPWSAYREFGIPLVDAALVRYGERRGGFA